VIGTAAIDLFVAVRFEMKMMIVEYKDIIREKKIS